MDRTEKDFNTVWTQEVVPILNNEIKQEFPDAKELPSNLNVPSMLKFLSKVPPLARDTATQRLGYNLLVEAERDIESCNALYSYSNSHSKRLYPHAVYHLQQAVEKAAKGYMLGFGLLSTQELKKTHNTPEIFVDALLKKTGIESWCKQVGDKMSDTIINDVQQVMSNPSKRQEIARIMYDEIMEYLSLIHTYVNRSKAISESLIERVSPLVGVEFPPPPIFQAVSGMVVILTLAKISFPHWEYTRYPDGEMVPSDYEANLGIVRAIPEIIKILEPEIQQLKATMVAHGFGVIAK